MEFWKDVLLNSICPWAGIAIKVGERVTDNIRQEGKIEGYNQASKEYEDKLRKQADDFLYQSKIYEDQKKEFNDLLMLYERYLAELEANLDKMDNHVKLQEMEKRYEAVCRLQKCS